MTAQEIIKQTEKLSPDEQKSLISFLVLRQLNPNESQNLIQLFHYKNDFVPPKINIGEILDKYTGKVKNVWNEDAQVYINKLREDDREF